ncbi:MAG TPA: flagellar protein, partial [Mycoplana sp.]|nr:flagellar protein [Mycoplana sp.]
MTDRPHTPFLGGLRSLLLPGLGALMLAVPGALAEERPVIFTSKATADEIREFCTNIADKARDQR